MLSRSKVSSDIMLEVCWRLKIFSCTYIHRNKCAFFENMVVTFILGTMITARKRTQGGLCPGGSLSRGSLSRGVSVQGVSVQGVSVQRGSQFRGGLCPGGLCLQGGLCPEGGSLSQRSPPVRRKSGWYASYWNVFVFIFVLKSARSVWWKYERFGLLFLRKLDNGYLDIVHMFIKLIELSHFDDMWSLKITFLELKETP